MPIFDYKCTNEECGFKDEYIKSISVPKELQPPEVCPKCGKEMKIEFPISDRVGIDFIGPDFQINSTGRKAWRKNLTPAQQASVLLGERDPW